MSIAVDLLVIGGGIQGLALMKELSADYSKVLVGTSLRVSETLQFHGYFASGWNAANLEAARVYCQTAAYWRGDLARLGLPSQQSSFYAALPKETVAALHPNWHRAGIAFQNADCPRPFDLSRLPAHEMYHFPDDLIFDAGPFIAQLQKPFAGAMLEGKVTSLKVHNQVVREASAQIGGETLAITPRYVLAACGAGNAALLQMAGIAEEQVARSQVVRPLHMVLARGPSIPSVSGYFLDLVVIAHPLDNGERLWLITYNPPKPAFTGGAIDMSRDPAVDPAVVRTSLEKLADIIPGFDTIASQCLWDVYVGWKTDAPGGNQQALLRLEYPKPYEMQSFGIRNFLAVWPNHWCLATPAAQDAAKIVRDALQPSVDMPGLPTNQTPADPEAARMKYVRSSRRWRGWAEFAKEYGARTAQ